MKITVTFDAAAKTLSIQYHAATVEEVAIATIRSLLSELDYANENGIGLTLDKYDMHEGASTLHTVDIEQLLKQRFKKP